MLNGDILINVSSSGKVYFHQCENLLPLIGKKFLQAPVCASTRAKFSYFSLYVNEGSSSVTW